MVSVYFLTVKKKFEALLTTAASTVELHWLRALTNRAHMTALKISMSMTHTHLSTITTCGESTQSHTNFHLLPCLTKKHCCFVNKLQGTASLIVSPLCSRASLELTEANAAHKPAHTAKENPPPAMIFVFNISFFAL